eukprot:COSAG01_NODE_6190_length_3803_cov_3.030238_3_plen_42_part_00
MTRRRYVRPLLRDSAVVQPGGSPTAAWGGGSGACSSTIINY